MGKNSFRFADLEVAWDWLRRCVASGQIRWPVSKWQRWSPSYPYSCWESRGGPSLRWSNTGSAGQRRPCAALSDASSWWPSVGKVATRWRRGRRNPNRWSRPEWRTRTRWTCRSSRSLYSEPGCTWRRSSVSYLLPHSPINFQSIFNQFSINFQLNPSVSFKPSVPTRSHFLCLRKWDLTLVNEASNAIKCPPIWLCSPAFPPPQTPRFDVLLLPHPFPTVFLTLLYKRPVFQAKSQTFFFSKRKSLINKRKKEEEY